MWPMFLRSRGMFRAAGTALGTLKHHTAEISSSAELIAKWQGVLLPDSQGSSSSATLTEQMRQLCQDAITVYSTEGAATVVPDAVTEVFMSAYSQLQSPQHKLHFFKLLVAEFGVQRQAVDEAVQLWLDRAPAQPSATQASQHQPNPSSCNSGSSDPGSSALMYRLAERLSAAAQPLYLQLLLPVAQHKAGIAFLVSMRSDLLRLLKEQPAAELGQQGVALRALDQDLRSALARWFSLGLLQLQRITWEHSPGQLLQRVQQTEAVHRMQHMEELQRRLQQSDRRVFAFMHPSLPGEPLVVLHTAILDHIPSSMQTLLAQQQGSSSSSDGGSCDNSISSSSSSSSGGREESVACFYSISSGESGLAGVDLGNFLIKKAATLLLSELPQLTTLVTLSPIPGFRAWLITKLRQAAAAGADSGSEPVEQLLRPAEVAAVLSAASGFLQASTSSISTSSSSSGSDSQSTPQQAHQAAAAEALLQLVQDNSWAALPKEQQEGLRPVLLRLCAVYLLAERRRSFALDPVAHFHLRNGAQLWRINWRADLSSQGLSNSCGLMVNYRYDMGQVVANNQAYLLEHHIAASPAVQQLLLSEDSCGL